SAHHRNQRRTTVHMAVGRTGCGSVTICGDASVVCGSLSESRPRAMSGAGWQLRAESGHPAIEPAWPAVPSGWWITGTDRAAHIDRPLYKNIAGRQKINGRVEGIPVELESAVAPNPDSRRINNAVRRQA